MKTKTTQVRKLSIPVPPSGPSEPASPRPRPARAASVQPLGLSGVRPSRVYREEGGRKLSDARPGVAANGAMGRLRARLPEFHKRGAAMPVPPAGAPRPRQIHGGLLPKRRAGK